MPTTIPIDNGRGILTTTDLTEIYKPRGGTTAHITSVNLSPQNLVTPYHIEIYLTYDDKSYQAQVYNKDMNGGDSVSDTDGMYLTDRMSIMVKASIANLISYVIIGEETTP